MTNQWPDLSGLSKETSVEQLDGEGKVFRLTASSEDCEALKSELSVPAVQALSGEVRLTRHGQLVRATGTVKATLTRECVASLEPLTENIDESFDETYTTERAADDLPEEVEVDLNAPEPLEGDTLNVGHVVLEQLVLLMDPHPRIEGAEAIADPGAGATISPFSVLKGLKS